jgi:hypothetical protein
VLNGAPGKHGDSKYYYGEVVGSQP